MPRSLVTREELYVGPVFIIHRWPVYKFIPVFILQHMHVCVTMVVIF